MITLLRKHQQTLMVFVTIIVIIAFVWLYDPTQRSPGSSLSDTVGHVYDRPVTGTDLRRGANKIRLCRELGLFELFTALSTDARDENEQILNAVFNSMILRHEAEALGLVPNEEEVVEAIKALPAFQTNGGYDSSKYSEFSKRLGAFGFTTQQVEEAVQDELRLKKIKQLLGTTIAAAPGEVRFAFERGNQKTEVSFVTLKSEEIAKGIEVSDEDVKKAFEDRKDTLKTDELRKVKAVAFVLSEDEKKLTGKERAGTLQKLVDRAGEFAAAMSVAGAKLEEVAAQFTVPVIETPDFSSNIPPKELNDSREASMAAFKLTLEQPNSDPVTTPNGYYVLQLAGVTPPRPLNFDEAKPKLTEQLKSERTEETLSLKSTELRTKIEAELKAGKTFAEAATAAGMMAEQLPPFSLRDPGKMDQPGTREMVRASMDLEAGELSEPVRFGGGRILCRIEKRLPVDEAAFEKEKSGIAESIARSRRDSAFEVWLAERRKLAKIEMAGGYRG